MKIEENRIIFKSTNEFWKKEHSGKKPYTVRFLDSTESYLLCDVYEKYKDNLLIEIINTGTGYSFTRKIRDITYFGQILGKYLIGIAWEIEEND